MLMRPMRDSEPARNPIAFYGFPVSNACNPWNVTKRAYAQGRVVAHFGGATLLETTSRANNHRLRHESASELEESARAEWFGQVHDATDGQGVVARHPQGDHSGRRLS